MIYPTHTLYYYPPLRSVFIIKKRLSNMEIIYGFRAEEKLLAIGSPLRAFIPTSTATATATALAPPAAAAAPATAPFPLEATATATATATASRLPHGLLRVHCGREEYDSCVDFSSAV